MLPANILNRAVAPGGECAFGGHNGSGVGMAERVWMGL